MPSNFPNGLDDFSESSPTYMSDPDSTGRNHQQRHDDSEAGLEAVQETLGVNPQGGSATVGARVGAIETELGANPSGSNATVAERLSGISSSGPGTGTAFALPISVDTGAPGVTAAFIRGPGGGRVFLDASGGGFHYFDAVGSNFRSSDGGTTVFEIAGNGLVRANGRDVGTVFWDENQGRRCFLWDTINNRWQMVYGDTGWRNITALAPNFTPGGPTQVYVRRVGDRVDVAADGIVIAPANVGANIDNTQICTLPAGFQPAIVSVESAGVINQGGGYWQQIATMAATTGVMVKRMYRMGADYPTTWITDAALMFSISFSTLDAWPSSLPGIAVGVIPVAENLLPGQADIDPNIPTGLTPDTDTSDWTVTYPDGPTP